MGIFICTMLFNPMIFLNSIQSSAMPTSPIRYHYEIMHNPDGHILGVEMNESYYPICDLTGRFGAIVNPTVEHGHDLPPWFPPRGSPPPRPQTPAEALRLPENALDGAFMYRRGQPRGIVRGGVVCDRLAKRPDGILVKLDPEHNDLVIFSGAPVAIYDTDGYRPFCLPERRPEHF